MHSDEEILHDPSVETHADNEDLDAVTSQILDAAISANANNFAQQVSIVSNSSAEKYTGPETMRKTIFILEPAVFFVFFGMFLSGSVYQNQLLYQSCVAIFNFNITKCNSLLDLERITPETKIIEGELQPYVARILMVRSLLESIIPAVISLFIGPYSDKYGRRPIILSTFSGYLCSYVILAVLSVVSKKCILSPWLFLLSSIPLVLSGGTCALITGIYSYISDVTTDKERATRMVTNECAILGGMMIGNIASGFIYAAANSLIVFSIAACMLVLALIYAYIYVVESLRPQPIEEGSRLLNFFNFNLVKDLISTLFRQRPDYDRAIIWLITISLTLAIFIMEGDGNILYLFVREKFEWTLKDFTLFSAVRIVVQICGSVFGLTVLKKYCRFSIVSMTLIAWGCCVLENTVRASAIHSWHMYLAVIFGFMRGNIGPMSRAVHSHVAPSTEVGNIYALTTSLQRVTPLAAAPLYTFVYTATLHNYPSAFNFISVGMGLLCFTLVAIVYGIQKSRRWYQAIG